MNRCLPLYLNMVINILVLLKKGYSEKVIKYFCFNLTNNNKNVLLEDSTKIKEIFNNFYSGSYAGSNEFDFVVTKSGKKKVDLIFVDEDFAVSELQKKVFENNAKNIIIFALKESYIKISNFLYKNMNFLNILRLTNSDILHGFVNNTYIYNPKILAFNKKMLINE